MTAYKNFIDDFSSRCLDLHGRHAKDAEQIDREVTLLLSLAGTAIVIPFERLRLEEKENCPINHPDCRKSVIKLASSSREHVSGDRKRLGESIEKFDDFLKSSFLGSKVWCSGDPSTWKMGKVKVTNAKLDQPDTWHYEQLGSDKKCLWVLQTIRRGFAHGNIETRSNGNSFENTDRIIDQIVFLSRLNSRKYRFIAVSPRDFSEFLRNWICLLKDISMPSGVEEEVGSIALAAE